MSGIRINQPFANANLPVGASLADTLISDANVRHWFQADANHVTQDGSGIVALLDRKGTGATFTRNAAGNSPALAPARFGGYSGADFNKAQADQCVLAGSAPNLAQPYSWAGVAQINDNAGSASLLSAFTTSSVRSLLQVAAGTLQLGFRRNTASALQGIALGAPFAFIASYDGTNIALSVGGSVVVGAAGASATSSAAIRLGSLDAGSQYWAGAIGDIIMCDMGVLDGTPAGNALAAKIRNYFSTVYGLAA